MPLRDYVCTNCGQHQERFYWVSGELPECKCGGKLDMLPLSTTYSKSRVFPFTTPHIDARGRPIVVEDIGHLRRLERQYGVVLSAFANEPSNPDNIKDPPQYRGEEIFTHEARR